MLVPLVRFFAGKPKPTAEQKTALRRWFWHCAFTQRYKAGTNRLVKEDLEKIDQLASGWTVFDNLNSVIAEDLFTKTWRINSTAAKAMICLLAQLQPKSFIAGTEVDLSDSLSAYNARQFHHIYPKAFLAIKGIQFHESNVIANICMLTASDNNAIGDNDPGDYFKEIPESVRDDVMERAAISPEFRAGDRSYADFIAGRASVLAAKATTLVATGTL